MKWFDNMRIPMRKAWIKVSKRLGFRRTGLVKLQKEVRTCQYEDVHILWDMLEMRDPNLNGGGHRKGQFWNFAHWTKLYRSC